MRLSSQRLQHPLFLDSLQAPFQKIDLQGLLADFALELRHLRLIPAPLSQARERIACAVAKLLPPAVQQVRIYFKCAGHFSHAGAGIQPLQRGHLHFF